MSYNLGIPINFDDKEYFEFIWHYERLVNQKKKEQEDQKKR